MAKSAAERAKEYRQRKGTVTEPVTPSRDASQTVTKERHVTSRTQSRVTELEAKVADLAAQVALLKAMEARLRAVEDHLAETTAPAPPKDPNPHATAMRQQLAALPPRETPGRFGDWELGA